MLIVYKTKMTFLCIIPVYNEEARLPALIKKIKILKKKKLKINFIFIDDKSSDNSIKIIKKSKIRYISKKKKLGIGHSLIYGLKLAIKEKYEAVIHLAGNGKMLPSEIPQIIKPIKEHNIDFVNGSRFLRGSKDYNTNPLSRIILIKILSFFISNLYKKKITDATCGFRAFKCKIFKKKLKIFDQKKFYTYGYEYYSIGKVISSNKLKFQEVPISMKYPKKGSYSKITPIIDWALMIGAWIYAIIDQKKID